MKSKSMIKNKRAGVIDLIIWIAISFITVLFFAFWIYGFDTITTTLAGMDAPILDNPNNSISDISEGVFGQVNSAQTSALHILAFVMIFISGISIPITYFVQKTHPVFFVVYLMVIIVSFIASAIISNQYELLMTHEVLGETISAFTGASFIMLNLPIWVGVIGFAGLIFLFSGIIRDAGAGGSVA